MSGAFGYLLVDEPLQKLKKSTKQVGIDLGLKDFAITSEGVRHQSPRALARQQRRLAVLQRQLSKKQKGSSNRNKARLKVAKLHAKISDSRKDFHHKLSTKLVRENQVLCVEH